jgi:NitT/TauT family transport system substrate-binding protein
MPIRPARPFSRRRFLGGMTLAGTAGLLDVYPRPVAAEPPPETTRLRFARYPYDLACLSPMWIGEELLRAEGFNDVQYVTPAEMAQYPAISAGRLDLGIIDIFNVLPLMDNGGAGVILGGVHAGCYELFAGDGVRSIRDLKRKTIHVSNTGRRAFVSAVVKYIGLDPSRDVAFVERPGREGVELLAAGKVDATLSFPPEPQELRARRIGTSILNTATDRPWSQYFCCVLVGNRDFVAKYPVATRRALRALLKATDLCASDPESVARTLVARGFIGNGDYAAQALREIPYRLWRDYDSADSVRYYALRLHELGFIKSDPTKLLAQGTDWRFFNELKKELKA